MEKNNATISISVPNPIVGIEKIKTFILSFGAEMYNGPIRQRISPLKRFSSSIKNPFKRPNGFKFNKKFFIRIALPVIAIGVFVFGVFSLVRSFNITSAIPNSADSNISVPDAVAVKELNKTFKFPIRDDKGKEVGNFDYTIENAELRKQIIVKGQRATAVSGRIFLIVNLKVTNNLSQEMELPSRAYLRIVVNNNNEFLAADIHNDPIEVLGKATKYTRIGIAIDEEVSKKPIVLHIGEIDGKKETIQVDFK